jgi:hypothetical protein
MTKHGSDKHKEWKKTDGPMKSGSGCHKEVEERKSES